jgi:hypothetical protein
LQFIVNIFECRSDADILGPQSQYIRNIVAIFAEVILIIAFGDNFDGL